MMTKDRSIFGNKKYDYFPMVEADQYGDHALKYLMQKAAKKMLIM